MTRLANLSKWLILAGVSALAAAGCKKDKASGGGTTAATQEIEPQSDVPDYQDYAPLPKAVGDASLPMLLDQNGIVEVSCFKKAKGLNTQTASMDIKAAIEKNDSYLKKVMTRWILDDVSPSGLTEDDLAVWDFGVEYPLMLETDPAALRFEEGQECIKESSGWLEEGVHAVTTVIGARNFTVTSKQRLTIDQQASLQEALKDKGFTMEGQELEFYKPAMDSKGNPRVNAEKEALFTGPGGISITEKELPPEGERGVKEFSFKAENPLFFGFRELPNTAWQKLQKKKSCYVFVVWGDTKPRAPECAEFSSASFGAEQMDDQTVKVEVTVDSDSKTLKMPYETTQKIVMGDRVMLWINVKKEEEGATIRFNSLAIGELFSKK